MAGASLPTRVPFRQRLRLWLASAAQRVGITAAHYRPEQHYMRGPGPASARSNTAERARPELNEPQDAPTPDEQK